MVQHILWDTLVSLAENSFKALTEDAFFMYQNIGGSYYLT